MLSQTIISLALATLIPLAVGYFASKLLLGDGRNCSEYLAHGYVLGVVAVMALMFIYDQLGVDFGFASMIMVLSGILVIEILLYRNFVRRPVTVEETPSEAGEKELWALLLALAFSILGATLLWAVAQEALIRPTFAWDAWDSWEPKAIQYFGNASLDAPLETTRNHGVVSPLAQLWFMLALSDTVSPLTHLPWILVYCAIALTLYSAVDKQLGNLWGLGLSVAFMSMPLVTTHTALSGYGDLWACAAFLLGMLSVQESITKRSAKSFGLATCYALVCILSKRLGIGLGLVIFISLLAANRAAYPKTFWVAIAISLALAACVLGAMAGFFTIDMQLPRLGNLHIDSERFSLPGFKTYQVELSFSTKPYLQALLYFSSWHLLLVMMVATVLIGAVGARKRMDAKPDYTLVAYALAIVYVVGYFGTLGSGAAENHTGLSRALLPLSAASLVVFARVIARSPRSAISSELRPIH